MAKEERESIILDIFLSPPLAYSFSRRLGIFLMTEEIVHFNMASMAFSPPSLIKEIISALDKAKICALERGFIFDIFDSIQPTLSVNKNLRYIKIIKKDSIYF